MERQILDIFYSKIKYVNKNRVPKIYFNNYYKKFVLDTGFNSTIQAGTLIELKELVQGINEVDFPELFEKDLSEVR